MPCSVIGRAAKNSTARRARASRSARARLVHVAQQALVHAPDTTYTTTSSKGVVAEIGPIRENEHDELFSIFADVVASGDGYPHAPPLSREVYASTFAGPTTTSIVARLDGRVVAGYYLRPNFVGKAAHIANAGYLVARLLRSQGLGRLIVEDSIARAPLVGFDAIQFNLVFASNPARGLYRDLGWSEIGIVPRAVEGQDAVIYHRFVGSDREHGE